MANKVLRICDLVVIGGGPAGISAALYTARQKVNFCLISKDIGGLANFIPDIESYLGYHYLSGYDLIKKFTGHLEDYKVNTRIDEEIKGLKRQGKWIIIRTDKGLYKTKTLILATGRKFRRLNIKGEREFEGKGVSFCAACDGPLFKGKTVAIIGGGLSGILSALFIMPLVKKIYLIESTDKLGGTKTLRQEILNASKKNVTLMTNTKVLEIVGKQFVNGIKILKGKKNKLLKVDGIFVEIGYDPNTEFAKGFVKLNNKREIVVDKNNVTSQKGVYAAGDVTDIYEKQVVVAVGEGAKAAMNAITYLEGL